MYIVNYSQWCSTVGSVQCSQSKVFWKSNLKTFREKRWLAAPTINFVPGVEEGIADPTTNRDEVRWVDQQGSEVKGENDCLLN